jgi:uncharacterized SAM-binding protein YcdF (DUF218 family)
VSWWKPLSLPLRGRLTRLYESMTVSGSLAPADLIFVMAGRPERKQYGLELYRAGIAPRLLLSIGRSEVGRMHALGLEGIGDLTALRDRTPPGERHFFVGVDATGIRIEKARLAAWNTYCELVGLRRWLEKEGPLRLIVVSTDIHLRRVAFTARKVFPGTGPGICYEAVPPRLAPVKKEAWWTRPSDLRFVLKEMVKLAGYRAILSAPACIFERVMQWNRCGARPPAGM